MFDFITRWLRPTREPQPQWPDPEPPPPRLATAEPAPPRPEKVVVDTPTTPPFDVSPDMLRLTLRTVAAVPACDDPIVLLRLLERLKGPDCYEQTAQKLGFYPSGSRPFVRLLPFGPS